MATLDGITVKVGDEVWMEGKRGRVVDVIGGIFTADFGAGFRLLVQNNGCSKQNLFGGRSIYWEPPLPVLPRTAVGDLQKALHATVLEHQKELMRI